MSCLVSLFTHAASSFNNVNASINLHQAQLNKTPLTLILKRCVWYCFFCSNGGGSKALFPVIHLHLDFVYSLQYDVYSSLHTSYIQWTSQQISTSFHLQYNKMCSVDLVHTCCGRPQSFCIHCSTKKVVVCLGMCVAMFCPEGIYQSNKVSQ